MTKQFTPIQTPHRMLDEFIKLSLWFVYNTLQKGVPDIEKLLTYRVDIYRNTTLFDGKNKSMDRDLGPRWAKIIKQLKRMYHKHMGDPNSKGFETNGLELLRPLLRTAHWETPGPGPRPYECWTFNEHDGVRIDLHVVNIYQPRSPLSEMKVPFAASLMRLLQDTTTRQATINTVSCGSWLNSVPRFAAMFPRSWMDHTKSIDQIGYTMNHWGQFINRAGQFHPHNGSQFRQTERLPFPCLICQCPIIEAVNHLEANFPDAVAYNHEKNSRDLKYYVDARIRKQSDC